MSKRDRVCLICYDWGKRLSTLSLPTTWRDVTGGFFTHSYPDLECLSLCQGPAAFHSIPEPGGMRPGLKHEALSRLCHLLVFLRNTDPATAAVSTKAFPLSRQLSERGAADQRERSKASCRWPRLADWKSSLWMSQEGNRLLSLFPLKKHSYTHR